MDLDLSDDQVALRDGIRSAARGPLPMDRVRAGFDRAMFDELAEAGVFSLRADGFGWADASSCSSSSAARSCPARSGRAATDGSTTSAAAWSTASSGRWSIPTRADGSRPP